MSDVNDLILTLAQSLVEARRQCAALEERSEWMSVTAYRDDGDYFVTNGEVTLLNHWEKARGWQHSDIIITHCIPVRQVIPPPPPNLGEETP